MRPVSELKKALSLFNNIPLLNEHVMDYSDAPQTGKRVGCLSNVHIIGDDVYGDISVWDRDAIQSIKDGSKKDLSCGYRCKHIVEKGQVDNIPYDLKMIDIIPNHLALVEKGRVKGAYVYDNERGVKNHGGKMANLKELLAKFGIKDEDINKKIATEEAKGEEKEKLVNEIVGILKGKLDDETIKIVLAKVTELVNPAKPKEDEEAKPEQQKTLSEEDLKKIKDEAISQAKQEIKELANAKDEVEKVAGKLATQDSISAYYKLGLQALGIDIKGISDSEFKPMFRGATLGKKNDVKIVSDTEAKLNPITKIMDKLPIRKY